MITLRPADELGKLARDYYHGLLSRDTYRQQRARLLESLLGDGEHDTSTRPRPGNPDRRLTETTPGQPGNLGRRSADKSRRGVWVGVLALGVACVAAALLFLSGSDAPPSSPVDTTPATAQAGIIERFLDDRDWSPARVSRLRGELARLGQIDRRRLEQSPDYAKLVSEVRAQIAEQRALQELTAGATIDEATTRLALELGLTLSREPRAVDSQAPGASGDASGAPGDADIEPGAPAVATDPGRTNNEPPSAGRAQKQPVDAATPGVVADDPVERNRPAAGSAAAAPASVQAVRGGDVQTPAGSVAAAVPRTASTATTSNSAPTQSSSSPASAQAQLPPDEAVAMPGVERQVAASVPQAADPAPGATRAVGTSASDSGDPGGCPIGLLKSRRRSCNDTLADGSDGPKLVVIAAGKFQLGSDWSAEEGPPQAVSITNPFALAIHETSQAEFAHFCRAAAHSCPAEKWPDAETAQVGISWQDATAYAAWLSAETGQVYRLPTEAEWEYAARAGETDRYPGGTNLTVADARFSSDSPVARSYRVRRNEFGLYHMLGNAREWVQDVWHDSHAGRPPDESARTGAASGAHTARGGCYTDGIADMRLSSRVGLTAGDDCTGFRLLRELR